MPPLFPRRIVERRRSSEGSILRRLYAAEVQPPVHVHVPDPAEDGRTEKKYRPSTLELLRAFYDCCYRHNQATKVFECVPEVDPSSMTVADVDILS